MMLPQTVALAAIALAATQVSALAHAYLIDSVPTKRQEVMHPLSRIRLTFSGTADAHFSVVKLTDNNGAVIAETTQQEASREMILPAPMLRPGPYKISYRVLSTDGDIVEGKVDFVVRAAADPAPVFEDMRPQS